MAFLYQGNYIEDVNFRNAWVITFHLVYILTTAILIRRIIEKKMISAVRFLNLRTLKNLFGNIVLN